MTLRRALTEADARHGTEVNAVAKASNPPRRNPLRWCARDPTT